MKMTTDTWNTGVNSTPIDIDVDCVKMDVLIQKKISTTQHPSDGRPYLMAMALRQSRTVFCISITMEEPTFRYPIKELIFLQHAPNLFQGFNLVIHAERSLFSRKLVDKHFSTALFAPIHPTSRDNRFLEYTLSKVIRTTSGHPSYDDPCMNPDHQAKPLTTITLDDLRAMLFGIFQQAHIKTTTFHINMRGLKTRSHPLFNVNAG